MLNIGNRLQLRDFRLIHAIWETGQLSLAAELLSMTQSAASRMLAGIEQSIGTPVFLRHPKGMSPTPVGEILARNAGMLLNELDKIYHEVDAIGSGRAGTVRVGAVTGGAVAFVVPAIRQLKKTATGADIHVDVAPSDVLIEGLMRGEYDFVLSRIPGGVDARQLSVQRGRTEEIHFMVRNGHPLAGRGNIPLNELAGYEWIIQAKHTPLRHAVEEAFAANKIRPPDEIVNTTSLLVMIAYLATSDAIGPVTREVADLVGSEVANRGLRALELDQPIIVNPYHLISRRGPFMSPLAGKLRDLVFDRLSEGDRQ